MLFLDLRKPHMISEPD